MFYIPIFFMIILMKINVNLIVFKYKEEQSSALKNVPFFSTIYLSIYKWKKSRRKIRCIFFIMLWPF